jgi:hypothetical protein
VSGALKERSKSHAAAKCMMWAMASSRGSFFTSTVSRMSPIDGRKLCPQMV